MSSNFEDTRFRYLSTLQSYIHICITCSSTLSTCALLGALMIVHVGVCTLLIYNQCTPSFFPILLRMLRGYLHVQHIIRCFRPLRFGPFLGTVHRAKKWIPSLFLFRNGFHQQHWAFGLPLAFVLVHQQPLLSIPLPTFKR